MTSYSFEPVTIPAVDEPTVPDPEAGPPEPEPELPDLRVAQAPVAAEGPSGGEPEYERRLDEARETAHERGFEEGRRAEAERLRTLAEALRTILHDIEAADARREREALDRTAALATAIAGHVIEREVRTSPDIVGELVRRAVAEFPVSDALAVHLNPSDLALLSSGMGGDAGSDRLTSGQSVRWVADPGVRPGGCLIEGSDRVVDARLSRILERVFRVLTDV